MHSNIHSFLRVQYLYAIGSTCDNSNMFLFFSELRQRYETAINHFGIRQSRCMLIALIGFPYGAGRVTRIVYKYAYLHSKRCKELDFVATEAGVVSCQEKQAIIISFFTNYQADGPKIFFLFFPFEKQTHNDECRCPQRKEESGMKRRGQHLVRVDL